MPSVNRSKGRDVHIYNANDPSTELGGLILTNGVTNANFYLMVEILFIFESTYFLRDEGGVRVQRDGHQFQPGNYYIVATSRFCIILPFHSQLAAKLYAGTFLVNNEPWLLRTISLSNGTRLDSFRNAVRERDGRCIISGEVVVRARLDNWSGFEASHIFPLAYEGYWIDHNYSRWITIPPATGSSINSVQNGLLLRGDIHSDFDNYFVSINPDV